RCRSASGCYSQRSEKGGRVMNGIPLTVVIFGASGDLTARKLMPSLYRLARKRRLPGDWGIVGVSRSRYSDDDFRSRMAAAVREHAAADWDESDWAAFARRVHYTPADVTRPGGLNDLQAGLLAREGGTGGRRLYYLAVAPSLYPVIA